jgi:hypothetical protein
MASDFALPSSADHGQKVSGVRALNVRSAQKLLEKPVFGDPLHIEAVRLLEKLEELALLSNGSLHPSHYTSSRYPCPHCKGEGNHHCGECGQEIDCHRCRGDGWIRESETLWLKADDLNRMLEIARREARRK